MHETAQPVVFLKQDSYYRNFDGMSIEEKRGINYDHPSAYDDDLLIDHLRRLTHGEAVDVPVYSYARYERDLLDIKPTSTRTPMSGSSAASCAIRRSGAARSCRLANGRLTRAS